MRDGKVSKKQGIDQSKYGSICANSKRKREHSDSGEAAIPGQDADGVAQVVPKRPHEYRSRNEGSKAVSRLTPRAAIFQALCYCAKQRPGVGATHEFR
jgi:hypothetical protein